MTGVSAIETRRSYCEPGRHEFLHEEARQAAAGQYASPYDLLPFARSPALPWAAVNPRAV